MKKNEYSATMYEAMPAVAGLNRVEGFDPLRLLRHTVSPTTGENVPQLDLACKKLWFRLANPKGRIQMNQLMLTEQLAVFEARVYLDCVDENPVSSFVSSCTRENAPEGRYVQEAQYAAMDEALTDAGFGLQFVPMLVNASYSDAGHVAEDGKEVQRTAVSAAPGGDTGKTGTMVRQFHGVPANNGTKTVPNQGVQPDGTKQAAQTLKRPGQGGQPVGSGHPAQTAAAVQNQRVYPAQTAAVPQNQRVQPTGNVQSAQTVATPQNQGVRPVGGVQPAKVAVMPQNQRVQSAESVQPVKDAVMPQGQRVQSVGRVQPAQAAVIPQNQRAQPIGIVQPSKAAVMEQNQRTQPGGDVQPVQTVAMPQNRGVQPVGSVQPAKVAVMPQNQRMQLVGSASAQAHMSQNERVQPADNVQSAQTVTIPQDPGVQPTGNVQPPQAAAMAQNQNVQPAGNVLPVQSGSFSAVLPCQDASPSTMKNAQATAQEKLSDQLPIPMESGEAEKPAENEAAASMDSLPVPPVGQIGQAAASKVLMGTASVSERTMNGNTQASVQEAMALLNGQKLTVGAVGSVADSIGKSGIGNAAGNTAAPAEAVQPGQILSIAGATAQTESDARYTPGMAVEDIMGLMTLEEAAEVVVETGASKGQTIGEIAERRPATLKFYCYGGYKGDNNILRAAAQMMLDSMAAQKAS